jgi:type I restriction enzyme S subunit
MPPVEIRNYVVGESATFRKTGERHGGLSNMAPGFPLELNGIAIRTSEALYQACRFPHLPDVQRLIIDEVSPMTAKMKSKPYRDRSRPDWDAVRVRIMRWCLRVKLAQNWDRFGALLLETGGRPIVEDSRKDDFWGAIPSADGRLVGRNVLGRLLMELRELLRAPDAESLRRAEPPQVSRCLLYGQPVGVFEGRARIPTTDRPRTLAARSG